MAYIHSLQSEWLKTKRSAASWICLIIGLFIPIIHLILFLKDQSSINQGVSANVWKAHFNHLWENMAIFLLPMGLILISSLVTQVEYRNKTWKQLHTTPQTYRVIFAAKFSAVILMTLKFFLFFNIGILFTGYVPSLLFDHSLPKHSLPVMYFLEENAKYFITCLPVMALQFVISMNFKNFLVPIAIGFLGLVGTLIGMPWQYIVISPYSYCPLHASGFPTPYNLLLLASLYFVAIIAIGYMLYVTKDEKG